VTSSAICPYCNSRVDPSGETIEICPACDAQHHVECWQENGGCTVYGCTAAPPDEPKLILQAEDFSEPAAAPPPPPGWSETVVPPMPPPPPPRQPMEISFSFGGYNYPAPPVEIRVPSKNRTGYVLLGVFLGAFGAHNFYAGYTRRAVAQLAITLCTLFLGSFISWIWALVEVCVVERDSHNLLMT
jgi:TM2 domain-containing membrane protein YozV